MNLNASPDTVRAVTQVFKLAGILDDRVTHPDKARIAAWSEQVQRHGLAESDLLDGLQAFYDGPSERAIQIGDLIHHARGLVAEVAEEGLGVARLALAAQQEPELGRNPPPERCPCRLGGGPRGRHAPARPCSWPPPCSRIGCWMRSSMLRNCPCWRPIPTGSAPACGTTCRSHCCSSPRSPSPAFGCS